MIVIRRLTIALLLLAAFTSRGDAQQSSIVPAKHSVYDWLFTQRVWGRLPTYDMETRPTSRGVILSHLRTLTKDSAALSWTDRSLLRDFLNEFDFDRLLKNGLLRSIDFGDLPTSVTAAVRSRKDPYLYAGRTADSSFAGAVWANRGVGTAYDRVIGDQSYYLAFKSRAWRAFFDSKIGLGASAELESHSDVTGGSLQLLGLDPKLDGDWKYRRAQGALEVWRTDAWVSYARPYVTVDYGTGAANYGPAVTDAILLRADGPDITQLRARIGTKKLNYLFTHASLATPALASLDTFRVYDGRTIIAPQRLQRWVAMHRLTWNPTPKLTLSGYEMVVYSQRGADPKYLNPAFPFFGNLNQDDAGNTDNGFYGGDVIIRPRAGSEIFASLLIDDIYGGSLLRLRNIGRSDSTLKTAFSVGLNQRLPWDLRLGLGFIHTDPWTYTHFDHLGAWEVNGRPLGAAIGPNSDEIAMRLTRWFPFRTRVVVGARRIRNGFNPVDSKGKTTKDVGGDLLTDSSPFGVFMQGADVQAYNRFEFELESEPIRGLKLMWKRSAVHSYQGTRVPSHTGTAFFRISYGF